MSRGQSARRAAGAKRGGSKTLPYRRYYLVIKYSSTIMPRMMRYTPNREKLFFLT
jgi:hypothetical protein